MEDYYLTLQVLNDRNTDWDHLKEEIYVGDYNHRNANNSPNTLAFFNTSNQTLLKDPDYLRCQNNVDILRSLIIGSRFKQ